MARQVPKKGIDKFMILTHLSDTMKDVDSMDRRARHDVKRRKGCSPEDFADAITNQDGKCAICQSLKETQLRADTFRKDGEITLVCLKCFRILEALSTNLDRFITYLSSQK